MKPAQQPLTSAFTHGGPLMPRRFHTILAIAIVNVAVWTLLATLGLHLRVGAGQGSASSPRFFYAPEEPQLEVRPFNESDRLTHIYMKLASDHFFGDLPIPPGFQDRLDAIRITKDTDFTKLRDGDVIYVDAFFAGDFIIDLLPLIRTRFVLITGDSGLCMPRCRLTKTGILRLTENPYLIYWWMPHCDGVEHGAQKMGCMHLGIDQHGTARADMQKAYEAGLGLVDGAFARILPWEQRQERYLLASFQVSTNKKARQPVMDLFCGNETMIPNGKRAQVQKLREVSNCFYMKGIDKFDFYKDVLAPSLFVLSPPGEGPDCYRTYETLLLGGYPIVKTSTLDSLFSNLPVLIVQDFDDLTVELLEKTYRKFQKRKWDYRPLYVEYWSKRVRMYNE